MKYAGATHVGRVRQENEDYFIAKTPVFIVADGMGGHSAGDLASKIAAQTVHKIVSSSVAPDKLATLKKAVEEANKKVINKSQQIQAKNGMGTTFTMAWVDGLCAYFAHIGDSRAYLLREGKLKQLTEDHSLVAEMVKQGKITDKEATKHALRNVITRAIGSEPNIRVDLFSQNLKEGDRLLIASDGLTSMVSDSQIKKLITAVGLKEACQKLIRAANEKGGQDNITVVLVDISKESASSLLSKATSVVKSKIFYLAIGILVVMGLLTFAFYLNNNSYYLWTYKGKVALYQGLPYKLGGIVLSRVKYVSNLDYRQLDKPMQRSLERKIMVKNEKMGLEAIRDMQKEQAR